MLSIKVILNIKSKNLHLNVSLNLKPKFRITHACTSVITILDLTSA